MSYLQSWLEGPTHIEDVMFRHNDFINCTADTKPLALGAQPGSFFSFCSAPSCHNISQVNNTAEPEM